MRSIEELTQLEDERWTFLGFESDGEGQPVQTWFNQLVPEDREAIAATLVYLQFSPRSAWEDLGEFDPLVGEKWISEIRILPVIKRMQDGVPRKFAYRLYGDFIPNMWEYTLLHGTAKRERNDKDGKATANKRHSEIREGKADFHKFIVA